MRSGIKQRLQGVIQRIIRSKIAWFTFFVAFLPRLIFLFQTYPLSIGGDELFAMGPAAKLVGYDWSGVMQNYRYYGYGYTVLLIPFLKFIQNPILLYRMMVFLMILAQSLSAPIAYHLMKTYFNIQNQKVLFFSSVCCSYLVAIRAVYTYPEFIYVLVLWLLAWVLLHINKIVDNRKKRITGTIVLVIILFYASTVHSRATAVWIAVAVGIIYYGWVYRKSLVSLSTCLIMGGAALLVSQKGIDLVLNYFVNVSSKVVSNTGVSFSPLYFIDDVKSWPTWLNIIIGQLNISVVVTGGLAVFAVVAMILLLWKGLLRQTMYTAELKEMSPYIVISSIFLTSVVVTIVGQSFSWLPGATNAMQYGGDQDAFRAFTYFRYYAAYVGPLLMVGIAYFYHNKDMFGKFFPAVCGVTALIQGYWTLCILPYVSTFSGCNNDFGPFSLTHIMAGETRLRTYLPATFVVIIVLAVSYILYKKRKMQMILGVLSVILIYSYCFNAVTHEGYRGQKNYSYVDDSVRMLKSPELKNVLPEKVFVEDASVEGTGQQTKYLYQFCLLSQPVVSSKPPVNEKEAIYLCQNLNEWQEFESKGYLCGKVADNEYVFVIGDELQEKIKEYGITLVENTKFIE